MSEREQIELVNRLRSHPAGTKWLKFKRTGLAPQRIGECLSALANSACHAGRTEGYLLLGVDGCTREVVGTRFNPLSAKGKENQDLLSWLTKGMSPCPHISAHVVGHPKGNVAVFETGAANGQPVSFRGTSYVRIGSSTTGLDHHPDIERDIWSARRDWSATVCELAGMDDLDPAAIAKARESFLARHPRLSESAKGWDDATLLSKACVLARGKITNAALLLLGKQESPLIPPEAATLIWVLKDADGKELDREHFRPPFLLAGDRLLERIRIPTLRVMPPGTLFPKEVKQYDPWVIKEALHNCIAHQDYRRRESVTVTEHPDRIVLANSGDFLPGSVEEVVASEVPYPIACNPFLAYAMHALGLIDMQGGGIRRMLDSHRKRFLPMPDYDLSRSGRVSVSIPGRIADENYAQLLMQRTDLALHQAFLLDQVHKNKRVGREAAKRLKAQLLVEGRYPNLVVTGPIPRVQDSPRLFFPEHGLGRRLCLGAVLSLVRERGPVSREEADRAIEPMLPCHLSAGQKRRLIGKLLRDLQNAGMIVRDESRARSEWDLPDDPSREPGHRNGVSVRCATSPMTTHIHRAH